MVRIKLAAVALVLVASQALAEEPAWFTYTTEHPMYGKQVVASARTRESFELRPPYDGIRQTAELELRKRGRGGDVMLSIQRGQLVCGYASCPVVVRWDDGPALTFKGNPPSDGSSETIFIPGFRQFVKRLGESEVLRIQVDVYQHGSRVFEFETSGFDPTAF